EALKAEGAAAPKPSEAPEDAAKPLKPVALPDALVKARDDLATHSAVALTLAVLGEQRELSLARLRLTKKLLDPVVRQPKPWWYQVLQELGEWTDVDEKYWPHEAIQLAFRVASTQEALDRASPAGLAWARDEIAEANKHRSQALANLCIK